MSGYNRNIARPLPPIERCFCVATPQNHGQDTNSSNAAKHDLNPLAYSMLSSPAISCIAAEISRTPHRISAPSSHFSGVAEKEKSLYPESFKLVFI